MREIDTDELIGRAASFMDEAHPGWAEKINLETFDIRNSDHCVGGQTGVDWEELGGDFASAEGVDIDVGWNTFATGQEFWVGEITAREPEATQPGWTPPKVEDVFPKITVEQYEQGDDRGPVWVERYSVHAQLGSDRGRYALEVLGQIADRGLTGRLTITQKSS